MAIESWEEKARTVRDYRDATLARVDPPLVPLPDPLPLSSIDLAKQLLTAREHDLTQNYDAIALLRMLRAREITSEELTRAFLRRAAVAQYAVNCVTELMWDEAIARAKYLDSLTQPIGPLHGLPISIKEHHGMKGKKCNASTVSWIDHPSDEGFLNDTLYDAGCVFYVRTTGPQLLMHLECTSNIYGRTVNPHNRNLTSGGSSGGEGALVAMRGSVLGVGGDIGGSIRCPASNNGVYGFKPTCTRISGKGKKAGMAGFDSILATYGPLCTSREAIDLFMKVALDGEPWRRDPSLTPIPWAPVTLTKPLKIAIEWNDGVVKPHPPVLRALREVANACRNAGMEVVDWVPLNHSEAWDIVSALYFPDGGEDVLNLLKASGEPILPLTKFIIHEQPTVKPHTMAEYWKVCINPLAPLCLERDGYRESYAKHWSATATSPTGEVDLILCPVGPGCAPPHETARYWGYTAQWNLLDYPGAVFPVTTVDPAVDARDENYRPRNDKDRYNYNLYTGPERYEGAPVSLQLVGRKFCDEKVIAGLEAIEKAMGRE
ncbi:acetamidase [Histoplasma capsulatum H143]|uniref:amidase n=1 Tax=Ajellomyces capsulatus (strain H143) TaxID=544712 RepID=C6HR98_AJECH|nr:acetamidase [Histoplasma capsulatum H143]